MKQTSITADYLKGITLALAAHAPHLLPVIQRIANDAEVEAPSFVPGTTIYSRIASNIPLADSEAVLAALQSIEKQVGFSTQFNGRQINALVSVWRNFAVQKDITPKE